MRKADTNPVTRRMHAKAVEAGVFQALMNAHNQPDREDYWFAHANKLEVMWMTDYKRHYSYFLDGYDGN